MMIMQKNHVVLWIPKPIFLGSATTPEALQKALKEQAILHEQLFYPTEIPPQNFPYHQDIVLNVDMTLGFSFKDLWFKESCVQRGIYNISENSLLVPLDLADPRQHPPTELAAYFKKCWLPLSDNMRS